MHSRDIIAIIELVFYIPTTILSIITCFRHGFHRSSGWIYTLILCQVRIAGAVCQIVSRSNHSSGLIQATIIIDSIGLSPLLFATLGMLGRFVDSINAKSTPTFTVIHFRLLRLLIVIGLVLNIVGGTSSSIGPDGTIEVNILSKVGIILYIVAFVALILMFLVSLTRAHYVPEKERRVPYAIIVALPFILVRLLYSACAVFLHNHLFNLVTGSVVVLALMAVIEEFIVVAIYVALGFLVDKLDENEQGAIAGRPRKAKKKLFGKKERKYHQESAQSPSELEQGVVR